MSSANMYSENTVNQTKEQENKLAENSSEELSQYEIAVSYTHLTLPTN